MTDGYAFGRDDVAARRLRMLHEVMAPASRALLEEVAGLGRFETVLDLGCGPGPSSALLWEVLRPGRLVGLDLSVSFLRTARATVPGGRFVQHDLRRLPWPGAPADLAYARYVLTHLPEPPVRLREWLSQLAPGGLLVLEENEGIACRQPVFTRYLEVVGELLTGRGQDLYVGPRLAELAAPHLRLSAVREVPAATAHVATMFRLNFAAWRGHAGVPQAHLDDLDADLAGLERSPERGEITWCLRQLVLGRT